MPWPVALLASVVPPSGQAGSRDPGPDGGAPGADPVGAALAGFRDVAAVVDGLEEPSLLLPTRCAGWRVADLLFHLLIDAQRLLVVLASPADGPPDTDAVAYWAAEAPGAPSFEHAQYVRRSALAYGRPSGVVAHWRDVAGGASRALAAADPQRCARTTQGQVMRVRDVAETTAVELAVHYLDLTVGIPDAPPAHRDGLALTRLTLDGLLGRPVGVPGWSDAEYALKGSGRVALTEAERRALGDLARRFPLLG